MGASKSVSGTKSAFSDVENEELKVVFTKIAGDGAKGFGFKEWKAFMEPKISSSLVNGLYNYMKTITSHVPPDKTKNPKTEDQITRSEFDLFLADIFKGSLDRKTKLLMFIVGEGKLENLRNFLKEVMILAEFHLSLTEECMTWNFSENFCVDRFIDHLMCGLFVRDGRHVCDVVGSLSPESTFTFDDLNRWLSETPLALQLIIRAFAQSFLVCDLSRSITRIIPFCKTAANSCRPETFLDMSSILFLNSFLPSTLRGEWRLLFNCVSHGSSFATMLKKILNEGPTILVIKDRGGNVFGGFAAESWLLNGNFYGSSHCFLFSLFPIMDVYLPTGYNQNFLYVNQNQQTLPNGLGMGGQWDYCGLWLSDNFGLGHSRGKPKCTTYGSPQLSSTSDFCFDLLEVWAVGKNPKDNNDDDPDNEDPKKKSGLLNMDPETKAMLEMLGKTQQSEAIRQADEIN